MSDWTVVSLKDYTDQRFADNERAIDKAAAAVDKRLDGMNEFRDQLRDQASTFLPRTEYQVHHEALMDRVMLLESWRNKTLGVVAVLTILSGTLGAVIIKVFFH